MALAQETLSTPSAQLVRARAAAVGEPSWLTERRLANWQDYAGTPLPVLTDETWRRTDLRGVDPDHFSAWQGDDRVSVSDPDPGILPSSWFAAHAAQSNWADPQVTVDSSLTAAGLIFCSLDKACRDHRELLHRIPGFADQPDTAMDKFVTLNGALWSGGLFVYVPKGLQVDVPLRSLISTNLAGIGVFPRVYIWVDDSARLDLIEEHTSQTLDRETLVCPVVYAYVGDDAQLDYTLIQNWGLHTAAFGRIRAVGGRDARVHLNQFSLGAALAKTYTEASFPQTGGNGQIWGLSLLDGRRHIDHETRQIHDGDHTYSNLIFKGVLRERARSVFYGSIRISDSASQSNTYQQNDNLLLSKRARADSIPGMEIRTYDVRCTHGATIGRIDEEELFYLMSRGFPRAVAEGLAIRGYVEPVLARIQDERVRGSLEREVLVRAGVPNQA